VCVCVPVVALDLMVGGGQSPALHFISGYVLYVPRIYHQQVNREEVRSPYPSL